MFLNRLQKNAVQAALKMLILMKEKLICSSYLNRIIKAIREFIKIIPHGISSDERKQTYICPKVAQVKKKMFQIGGIVMKKKFPNLSRISRYLFSIQATSVSAVRLFSRSSLTIRKHRNKLNNDSIKWLMCLNSWVTCSLAPKIQKLLPKSS